MCVQSQGSTQPSQVQKPYQAPQTQQQQQQQQLQQQRQSQQRPRWSAVAAQAAPGEVLPGSGSGGRSTPPGSAWKEGNSREGALRRSQEGHGSVSQVIHLPARSLRVLVPMHATVVHQDSVSHWPRTAACLLKIRDGTQRQLLR